MRRQLVLSPIIALTLILMAASVVSARSPVALGITSERSRDMNAIADYKRDTGAKPALWTIWSDWGDRGGRTNCVKGIGTCSFPMDLARALRKRGVTPFMWWQPTDPANPAAGTYERHRNIIKGKHDKYIRQWAKAAKAFGRPVIVRFAHEMNGTWFPWGIGNFDNTPQTFVAAWRHIVDLFRDVGARNVKFLWSPYNMENGAYRPFYPGNEWVDYVGATSLNWGADRWRTLDGLLRRPLAAAQNVSRTRANPKGKPVILPEVGSNYYPLDKAAWIRDGYKQAIKKYPAIRAMVYFDYNTAAVTVGQPDWRLVMPEDGTALAAYRTLASSRIFSASFP